MNTALEEEQFRVQQIREQIIDLSELHQNENRALKQDIADLEEKVQYQSEERLRDIYDSLDGFQARVSYYLRYIFQQLHHDFKLLNFYYLNVCIKILEVECQAQNYVSLEGIENSNARTVLVKLLNLVLMVVATVFTAGNTLAPFFKTRYRAMQVFMITVGISVYHLL